MSDIRVANDERTWPALAARWLMAGLHRFRLLWARSLHSAREPVDMAWLAAFRIAFGTLLVVVVLRTLGKGWVHLFFDQPSFHFAYPGFEFVQSWPKPWMRVHFASMCVFALGITAGCYYRVCCVGFLFSFAYVELIDQALYLNHYYLVTLLTALLCVLPANGAWSVDVWCRPRSALQAVPRWTSWVMRVQVAVVYLCAGLGKLNRDWLLEAQPLKIWLAMHGDWPFIGPLLERSETASVASWAGALFDLGIVFVLCQRRLAPLGWAALFGFHIVTALLFPIGVFPWLMTVAASVFLAPDAVRRACSFVRGRAPALSCAASAPVRSSSSVVVWRPRRWVPCVLGLHCVVQVSIPAWHHWRKSDSVWTGEGFNFAWKVMLAQKAGAVTFRACERHTASCERVLPDAFLAPHQVVAMAQDPYLVRAAAREIHRQQALLGKDVAVYADAFVQVNGQPAARLIEPRADLTSDAPGWIVERATL